MGILEQRLRARVQAGSRLKKIPKVLSGTKNVKRITEAFPKSFWFYHPVKCSNGSVARRPVRHGLKETYSCRNGTKRIFYRSLKTANFFKRGYGRGGEFAQGLYAVLRKLGYKVRLVLGYWHGSDALWVEIWRGKKWIPLDPAAAHGYGRKFPKPGMRVMALANAKAPVVNRTKFYKITKSTLTHGGFY